MHALERDRQGKLTFHTRDAWPSSGGVAEDFVVRFYPDLYGECTPTWEGTLPGTVDCDGWLVLAVTVTCGEGVDLGVGDYFVEVKSPDDTVYLANKQIVKIYPNE